MSEVASKYVPRYVLGERDAEARRLAKGTLKHGLKIGGDVHREFTLRESLTSDLLAAEKSADVQQPLSYSAALLALQLVSIGRYTGPFTAGMLGTLRTADFWTLRQAQEEFDLVGEAE